MKRLLAVALLVLALGACDQPQLAYACGTLDRPPIAVPSDWCDEGSGVWYSAPPADVSEPDEQPIIGQPLDGDWWDAADRNESRPSVAVPPSSSARPSSTPARPSSATKSAPPTTRRR